MSAEGAKCLAETNYLQKIRYVSRLAVVFSLIMMYSLGSNPIGDQGARCFAKALETNGNLTELR